MNATLRLRMLPRFPARIVGTDGVKVTREPGSPDLVVSLDYANLGDIAGIPDPAQNYFAMYDAVLGTYVRIPFQAMFDAAGVTTGYPTISAAELANIPVAIHALYVLGDNTVGDGAGGLFIDTNNGSAITFMSGDGRTWYLAEDINENRLLASLRAKINGAMQKTQNLNDVSDKASARLNLKLPTYVADRTALKALNTTKDAVAILTEVNREGEFKWTAGNFSSQITADTQEGIYVKADAIASTAGAWVRVFGNPANAKWFGVTGNGTANENTASSAAVALAFALGFDLYWVGTCLTTANIPNFHDVRHSGPGVIKRESLAPDIVINGDFSSSTGWTLTNATISDGTLNFSGLGVGTAIKLIAAIKPLTTYEITYTIVSVSAGNTAFRLEGSTPVFGTSRTAPGTYTERLTSNATTKGIRHGGSATFNGVIDNLTVREVVTDLWNITPPSSTVVNHVYAAASGGAAANDGLSSSQPINTFQNAINALVKWAPLEKGQWQIDLAAGQYARGRFPDEGLPSSFPIIVAGPPVIMSAGAAFKLSITGRTGNFTNGETITFSTSGATATLTFVDNANNVLFATLVSGTPVVGQTVTGGTSAATATTDYQSPTPLAKIKEGATQTAVGILGFYTSLRVRDVEIEDYNGSTSSNGVRVDNSRDLFLENVHLIDCYHGASVFNHSKLDVKGGFAYDNGYLNSVTGGGYAYRLVFHGKAEIGTQGAGDLLSGPAIKGNSGTVRAQELSTGHLDFALQHDNDGGARLLVNSRLNIDGSSFKRNSGSATYCTQGSYVDPTSNTIFGTGVDANGSNFSGGSASNASLLGIDTFNMGNATEYRSFRSAFPGTVVTSVSSVNSIDSITLKGGVWNNAILTGIAAKKIRLRVWGTLAGTTGTFKRLQLRLGASSIGILSFSAADSSAFNAALEMIFTGVNAQLCVTNGAVSAGAGGRVSTTALTEDMTTDKVLAFQAYVNNAGDSITINGYEWEEMGV